MRAGGLVVSCMSVVLGAGGLARAEAPAMFVVKPRFTKGQRVRLERITARGRRGHRQRVRSEIIVEVLDVGNNAIELRWTTGRMQLDEGGPASRPAEQDILRLMAEMTDGLHVDFVMDHSGRIQGLKDWQECQKTGRRVAAETFRRLQETGTSDEAIKALKPWIEAKYASKASVHQSCLEGPAVYFFPLGWKLSTEYDMTYEDLLPNPLGGPPLPCKGIVSLVKGDARSDELEIRWSQYVDREKATSLADQAVKRLGETPKAAKRPTTLPLIEVEDRATFTLDRKTGWTKRVRQIRTVRQGGRIGGVDVVTMRVVEPASLAVRAPSSASSTRPRK